MEAKCKKCKRFICWQRNADDKWVACDYGITTADDDVSVFDLTLREVVRGGRGFRLHRDSCQGRPNETYGWDAVLRKNLDVKRAKVRDTIQRRKKNGKTKIQR